MKKLLTIIPLIFFFFSTQAQYSSYQMDTLTVEDGLSHDAVTAILKDSQGFMWFSTQFSGLQRFDGYEWKTYKFNPTLTVGLSSDAIRDLAEDTDGTLWIATRSGLDHLDPVRDLVIHYYDQDDSESGNHYLFVYPDANGGIWLGSRLSLKHFDPLTKTFTRYVINPMDPTNAGADGPNSILEDRDGIFWVGTSKSGLYKLDRNNGTFEKYPIAPRDSTKLHNSVMCLYEDHSGNLWVGTYQGLYMFNRKNLKFTRMLYHENDPNRLEHQSIAAIIQDNQRHYWIRTYGSLNQYSTTLEKLNEWEHPRDYPIGPEYGTLNRIRSVFPDSSGIIWYSNNWHGLVKMIPKTKKFTIYQNHPDLRDRAAPRYLVDEDIIWTKNREGISKYNRKSKSYQLIRNDPKNANTFNHEIWTMHRDQIGNLWVGDWNQGLSKVIETSDGTRVDKRFMHIPNDSSSISGNSVNEIHEDHNGTLYISTIDGGIDVLDTERAEFLHIDYGLQYQANILLLEKSGKVWATSLETDLIEIYEPMQKSGQYSLRPDTVVFHNFELGKLEGFRWPFIQVLHKGSNGVYWIGSLGRGLIKMTSTGNQEHGVTTYDFEQYTTEDGLSHDFVAAILEDAYGRLWLGTENGISRFDPDTETFTNYGRKDGQFGIQYSWNGYKSPDGEMFFPCEKGLLAFYPDSIVDNTYIPPIVITELRVFDKQVNIDSNSPIHVAGSRRAGLELPHNQNFLAFEYAALNYIHPEQNQYKYKMEGLNEDWIEAGTRRYASYPDLNPGEYTFRVIGSNNDNIWNTEGASLNITILPPWWATAYAYIAYAFLTILIVLGYARLRTWQIRKERDTLELKVMRRTEQIEAHREEIEAQKEILEAQNRKIREMDQMKTHFFTNVSHEFRTPLTMIQGPVQDLMENARLNKKELGKLQVISRNAKRLLHLVNQLLDIAKLESGLKKLKLSERDVMASLRAMAGAFSSLAETKGIVYNRLIPSEKFTAWFDPGILEKIVTNLLSNAFKFTPEAGEITFSARQIPPETPEMPDQIECVVTDQGPGIPEKEREMIFSRFYQVEGQKASVGTGIGLSLVKDLVKLCHGHIAVKSEEGKGSTFIVRLPLGKHHLKESEYVLAEQTEEDRIAQSPLLTNGAGDAKPAEVLTEEVKKSGKPIVLIAEDNSDIRNHVREHLKDEYEVVECVNGKAGMVKAFDIMPELVITDLMMPEMDGVELCRQLKSDERTSHIPVIMLTAKATTKDKLEGLETGADDYISKPFEMRELITRVANLIEQRRRLRERYSREITLEPKDIAVTSIDEAFLKKAIDIVEDRMADEAFDMEQFQDAMTMSHSTLFRKLQALTDQSPTVFIRNIRLKRAAQLLREHYGNVATISFEVGFNNPSYFSKCFKELYGVSPADFLKQESTLQ